MLYLSFVLVFLSLFLSCYTLGRVYKLYKNLKDLDWQSLGTLTGDVGALKVSYQRLNNRIGGMASSRNMSIDEIAIQAIQNAQPAKKSNGSGG